MWNLQKNVWCERSMFESENVYRLTKLFKEGRISIQDEIQDRPTMASTPEMVDIVNALILANRRVTIEEISKQLWKSLGTTHKIVHDYHIFSKVSYHWVSSGQCNTSYNSQNSGNNQSVA